MDKVTRLNRWSLGALITRTSGYSSKSALAREAEIAPSTLADLESGRRDASEDLIGKLADALAVDPRALLADPYGVLPPLVAVADAARQLVPHINGHDFGLRQALADLDEAGR